MSRLFVISVFVVVIFSCSEEGTTGDPILKKPPYDKLTDSIAQAPKNATLYYHRGSMFYHNNQLMHAEQDLKTAWELEPVEAYALSVVTVLKKRNVDTAITFIQSALQKVPESVALQVGLARGYQSKGELQRAVDICNSLLERYPYQLDALSLKSELLKQLGKKDEALATLQQAYDAAPDDREILSELAYDYAENKNARALALSDILLRNDPSESAAKAFYIKATYFKNIGNVNDALKYYNFSIQKNYNFLDAYLDKGIMIYNQKSYSDAEQVFKLGLTISPSTADFYYWLGKCQEATGNKADAKLNYQRAYTLDKTITEAKAAADRL